MASNEQPQIFRPQPRRPFELGAMPSTRSSSRDESPTHDTSTPAHATATAASQHEDTPTAPPSRTRSILNLTSSTLFGIYSPSTFDAQDAPTPSDTRAATPTDGGRNYTSHLLDSATAGLGLDEAVWRKRSQRRRSSMLDVSAQKTQLHSLRAKARRTGPKKGLKNYWIPLAIKNILLGIVGVCYGVLISHLHDKQHIAPVPVNGIPHQSWAYLATWGCISVLLGQLMPWVDQLWEKRGDEDDGKVDEAETVPSYDGSERSQQRRVPSESASNVDRNRERRGWWAPEWNDVVRSIGAFVGIAFAIRKLPWQSTLQLSVTLALSNPAVWYLIDRTPPGFVLSTTVALSGTAVTLAVNPDLIPTPAGARGFRSSQYASTNSSTGASGLPDTYKQLGESLFSLESLGVATWIASVLFVSCVCFGNIGRRL